MSDINFSTPNPTGSPGLQVIDRERGKASSGYVTAGLSAADSLLMDHAKDAADFAHLEASQVGRENVAAVERSSMHISDRVCDGFDRTNDNIFHSSARTTDKVGDASDRTNDNIYHTSARTNDRLAAATERTNDRLSAVSERTNDNLYRGFETTQREIYREFARTHDVFASKFEHQDRFMAQNFKEIQLQQAKDTCAIEREILRAKAELELQACKDKAALELRLAECCCETQATIRSSADETENLIRTLDSQKAAAALAQANLEILTLKLFAGVPPAVALSAAK